MKSEGKVSKARQKKTTTPYLTQQAPAMTKARDPATMTTLLTTEKTYIKMVRGKKCCRGLLVSREDIIPESLVGLESDLRAL